MKKVIVLATGGTIVSASEEEGQGLKPQEHPDALFEALDRLRASYEIEYRSILNLDSSNIQLEEWQTIARNVYECLPDCDGIVITHGTDTMAYTASVLTYMLPGLDKPVILTGSQLPIQDALSDARNNLVLAFKAVEHNISGVNIAFNYKIIRGCRAVKVRTMGFDAFESVNFPVLAQFSSEGMKMTSERCACVEKKKQPLQLRESLCNDVFLLKLVPGLNPAVFDMLLSMNYKGVVLEAFGVGGFHFLRRDLSDKIKKLVEKGISVVVCSQCLYERSDFSVYEVGRRVLESGAIEGRNMTTEACITKLMWALGQTQEPDVVRDIFNTDFAGEVTL